mgnify:CR=1 FL=1
MAGAPLLDVDDLHVSFRTEEGVVRAVDGVAFHVDAGEVVALVGESGSGKSATALTLMGLTRGPHAAISGRATFAGVELVGAAEAQLRRLRGRDLAIVLQDPMTALNPVLRIGDQIVEQIRAHERCSTAAARDRAAALLERVGIARARERLRAYPHECSGGMRQRVAIAMALACGPRLLIADEPTTALDVTTQAQILAQLDALRRETGAGVLLVTHDLGVVAQLADRVAVMYAGRIVEHGTVADVFADPQHPYTWGLLGSLPRVDRPRPARLPAIPGQPPSPLAAPTGCRFRERCPHAHDRCRQPPDLRERAGAPGHADRCVLDPAAKRRLRVVDGRIGLDPTAGAVAP